MWQNLPVSMQKYDSVCLQSQFLGDACPQSLRSLSRGNSELHRAAGGRGDGQTQGGLKEACSPTCRLRGEAAEVLLIHPGAVFFLGFKSDSSRWNWVFLSFCLFSFLIFLWIRQCEASSRVIETHHSTTTQFLFSAVTGRLYYQRRQPCQTRTRPPSVTANQAEPPDCRSPIRRLLPSRGPTLVCADSPFISDAIHSEVSSCPNVFHS